MMQVDRTVGASPPRSGGPDRGWSLGAPDRGWSLGAPDRGWSLGNSGSGRLSAILGAALLVSAIVPTATFAAGYDPALDVNSMANTTAYSGAAAWWTAGYTGRGVDVALIDTGVSPVAGLAGPSKVVYGPDLSLESQAANLRNLDSNGHGTFMAGLIAGKDDALTAPYALAPASAYRGVAPDARIVSVKVATADGGTDVSQVIAAIDWVVQHKDDGDLNIRVLNLSFGTDSTQPYDVDPLAFAVEQAWNAGIFVVIATGNEGYVAHTGSLTSPATDPLTFAVGASDSMGTSTILDDTVASFSSTGSPARSVDIVAPGAHLQGLRVPNSFIDATYPGGRIDDRYFRGSGTSEAAAFMSGAAALAIQRYPTIDPVTLKSLLRSGGRALSGFSARSEGHGEIDLAKMLTTTPWTKKGSLPRSSNGTGSLELARGSEHLTRDGVVLTGEQDIFGKPFDAGAMAALEADGSSWSGGTWNGSSWSGSSWSSSSWSGSSWSGSSWSGSSWSGSSWSGSSWSGSSWSGSTWSGSSWSGSSWSGSSWSSAGWN
jgi:serine protease AprX